MISITNHKLWLNSLLFLLISNLPLLFYAQDWLDDLPTILPSQTIHKTYSPIPGEGIKQLVNRVGYSLNTVESKVDVIDDKVDTIESKVFAQNDEISTMDSKLDVIDDKIDTLDSKIDILDDKIDTLDSKIDVIDDKIDTLDSKIDILDDKIDTLDSKIDVIDDKIDTLDSKIDVIDDKVDTIESKVFAQNTEIDEIISREVDIESKIDVIDRSIDDLLEIETVESHCPTILYTSDFGATGTTISVPGYYILCDDVPFAPSGACSAITTATDHVTIDLNYHTIYQPGTQATVDAITINPNVHDVTIKNGTISDFTRYGIYVNSTSGAGCYNLTFENIKIENSGSSGIYFDGASGSEIHDCIFRNCSATNIAAQHVGYFEYCNDIKIFDSTFNNNTATGSLCYLLYMTHCNKLQLSNCQTNDNLSTINSSDYEVIWAQNCSSLLLEHCSINNNSNTGSTSNIELLSLTSCYGCRIDDCSIIGNSATQTNQCIWCSGNSHTISSCFLENNSSDSDITTGIMLTTCTGSDIIDCTCNNLSGNSSSNLRSIYLNADNCSIQNCKANYSTNSGTGDAIGIYISSNADNCYVKDCSTFSNKTNGIKNDSSTTQIVGCVSGNNGTANYSGASTAVTPHYARRNTLGNHFEIGEQENISIETTGINDVGCVVYLDASAFATTLTISDPGYYILCEDVPFAPGGACSAITTATDHVTIDLNNHAIYQPGTQATVDAITINPNVHDVTIKNGTISDFTRYGIYVNSTSGAGCYNLTFENIKIEHSGNSGIYFDGASSSEIHDCIFRNCSVTNVAAQYVGYFEYCNDIKIFDSVFNNNTYASNPFYVLYMENCNKLQLNTCCINDNSTTDVALVFPLYALTCYSLLFEHCLINNNSVSGTNTLLSLVTIDKCYGCKIDDCSIINSNSTDSIYGIYDNEGSGNTISSCFVQSNTSSGDVVYGIFLNDCAKTDIIDCTCNNQSGNKNASHVYGIYLDNADNCSIQNCKANYSTNAGTGDAIGIYIGSNSENCYIKNCSTFSNKTVGIKNDDATTQIVGCTSSNSTTNFGGTYPATYARRNELGSHWDIGEQENISIETTGINDVGCVIYLDKSAFGTSGITLSDPGYYILCDDVELTSGTAVTIAHSFVTIDLNNKSISGTYQNGVVINTGIHNITVKNGSLSNFSQYGIFSDASAAGDAIYNVTFADLIFSSTSCTNAIRLLGREASKVREIVMSNCTISNNTAADVAYFSYCDHVDITNCSFNNNTSTNTVLYFSNSNKGYFTECQFDNNSGSSLDYIVSLDTADACIFDSCTINGNTSDTNLTCLVGNNIDGSIIRNCMINRNSSTTDFIFGIYLTSGTGNKIESCQIHYLESVTTAIGIYLTSTTSNIIESSVINHVTASTDTSGIAFIGESHNIARNCTVHHCTNYGIYLDNTADTYHEIINCSCYSNSNYGIYNDPTSGTNTNIIAGCVAGNNGTANFGGNSTPHYARRNTLGNHFEIGEQENISIETTGINDVGCVVYLDASAFGTTGITLSDPGYYILCEDVTFTPTSACSAITTATAHVTIDLNYHAIYQSNTQATVNAIKINPNVHDVTIKNGSISDFTRYGIYVDSTSGTGCYNLTFENIKIEHSGSSGIYFDGANNSEIHDCIFRNCSVTNVATQYVVWFEYCNDIRTFDSTFNNNTATVTLSNVLYMTNCNKLQLSNCQINDNSAVDILNYTPIYALNSSTLLFEHCSINNNSLTSDTGNFYILRLTSCDGCKINNCSIIKNSSSATGIIGGIYDSSGTGNMISSCFIQYNNAPSGSVCGIIISICAGVDIMDCTCNNQSGNNASDVCGIDFVSSDNCSAQNCKVNYSTNGTGDAIGIYIDGDSENCYIKDCSTFSNDTVGIKNDDATTQIVGCTSSNNTTNFGGTYPATYARRNTLGNHFEIGEQENISIETTGINDVGCVVYLDESAFGTTGITLSDPGYYILCEDVPFTPTGACSAITTATDHITIDLNYHAIYQNNSQATVDAITINPNVHDVTIKNGTISDFTRYGIHVDSTSGTGCYNLTLENMNIENTGSNGIYFQGSSSALITNCTLFNCMQTNSGNVGLYLVYCNNFNITDCHFTNNTSSYGGFAEHSNAFQIIRCHFDHNSSGFGASLSTTSFLFDSCTFNHNTSSTTIVAGLGCTCDDFIVRNCIANYNRCSVFSGGSVTRGFLLQGDGHLLESCIANNNSSATNLCYGIELVNSTGCRIENCTSMHNTGTGSGKTVAGIYLDSSDNSIIANCKTDANLNTNATDGYGIYIDSDSTKCIIKDCSAFANSGYGIVNNNADTNNPTLVTGCAAGNNGTANYSGTSAAITPHYARRNELGSHWKIGEQENISIETTGINDVGCVVYLDASAFPYTISSPGTYILCEDVLLTSGTAITINSNFVTLDLNGKAIYGAGLARGITINPDTHDIIIKNGSIADFSQYGIYSDSTAAGGNGIYNIKFEDLIISNTDSSTSAIRLVGTVTSVATYAHDISLSRCTVSGTIATSNVIYIQYCDNISITDCYFNSNTSDTDIMHFEDSNKGYFTRCHFDDNYGSSLDYVIYLDTVYACILDSCTINRNSTSAGSIAFYCCYCNDMDGSIIRNCTISSNSCTAFSTITGVLITGGQGNKVESCQISHLETTASAYGSYLVSTTANIIENTLINNILGGGSADAIGIYLSTGIHNLIRNCTIHHCSAGNFGWGIYLLNATTTYHEVIGCSCYSNSSHGIYNNPASNTNIIVGCIAGNNGVDDFGGNSPPLHNDISRLGSNTFFAEFWNYSLSTT